MPRRGAAELRVQERTEDELVREVLRGLCETPKHLPCHLFYDQRGSRLFEQICDLPEYYPTRTEIAILEKHAIEIAEHLGPGVALIETGAGSREKVRILLQALRSPAAFVPVDVSGEHLELAAADVSREHPEVSVLPVCADFTQPLELPELPANTRRRVAFFPGSTIGNFARDEAVELLRRLRALAGRKGALLLGADRVKPRAVLEAAYDDAAGVTARFNQNILHVVNREFGANFQPESFAHRALWDEEHQRIEMRLVSPRAHTVTVGGKAISFTAGEVIVTEHSHKYTLRDLDELARAAGLRLQQCWSDERDWFSVLLLESVADATTR